MNAKSFNTKGNNNVSEIKELNKFCMKSLVSSSRDFTLCCENDSGRETLCFGKKTFKMNDVISINYDIQRLARRFLPNTSFYYYACIEEHPPIKDVKNNKPIYVNINDLPSPLRYFNINGTPAIFYCSPKFKSDDEHYVTIYGWMPFVKWNDGIARYENDFYIIPVSKESEYDLDELYNLSIKYLPVVKIEKIVKK